MSPGSLLEASWGASWGSLGGPWGALGASWVLLLGGLLLGASWGSNLGSLLGPPGRILGASWGHHLLGGLSLGLPGRLLGPSWRPSIKKRGGFFFRPPVGAFKWASWGPLEALLGRSWALLGHSWGPLGAVLGHLGAPWGSSRGLLGLSWPSWRLQKLLLKGSRGILGGSRKPIPHQGGGAQCFGGLLGPSWRHFCKVFGWFLG